MKTIIASIIMAVAAPSTFPQGLPEQARDAIYAETPRPISTPAERTATPTTPPRRVASPKPRRLDSNRVAATPTARTADEVAKPAAQTRRASGNSSTNKSTSNSLPPQSSSSSPAWTRVPGYYKKNPNGTWDFVYKPGAGYPTPPPSSDGDSDDAKGTRAPRPNASDPSTKLRNIWAMMEAEVKKAIADMKVQVANDVSHNETLMAKNRELSDAEFQKVLQFIQQNADRNNRWQELTDRFNAVLGQAIEEATLDNTPKAPDTGNVSSSSRTTVDVANSEAEARRTEKLGELWNGLNEDALHFGEATERQRESGFWQQPLEGDSETVQPPPPPPG